MQGLDDSAERADGVVNVVLLDDEVDILRAYQRMLPSSYAVQAVTDGNVAMEIVRQGKADVVITDVMMPNMNGLDVVRGIRALDPDLPVILMSTSPTLETAMSAIEFGAFRYFTKPVSRNALEQAVALALEHRRKASEQRRAVAIAMEIQARSARKRLVAEAFDAALAKLFMVYQPIVSWSKKEVLGYEALARSAEPRLPNPGVLFGVAEEIGALQAIGRRIRELAPAPFAGAAKTPLLFLNLHTRDLDDEDLFGAHSPLAQMASRVVLEITERASLNEVPQAQARIKRLRELGYRIAVDDLGAGYAGLASFAMTEPDVVKIDMSLVRGIDHLATNQTLVKSLVGICSDLGIQLVAEGVESAAERDTLVSLGCDLFQGYAFARPGPPFVEVTW